MEVFDVEDQIKRGLDYVRDLVPDGEVMSAAILFRKLDSKSESDYIAMPDADDAAARSFIKRFCRDQQPEGDLLVLVWHEAWFAYASEKDPLAMAELKAAHKAKTLHLRPDKVPGIVFFVEGTKLPIRRWTAHIKEENGKRVLGEWEEDKLTLPRPGFKRYLPEVHT